MNARDRGNLLAACFLARVSWPMFVLGLAIVLAGGCGGRARHWPFPGVEAQDDDVVVQTLQSRVSGVRTLYATLSMSFEMPEQSAVAETVVNYRRPDAIRMSAYKELLVSSREIFDVVITPDRFAMRLETDSGPERHEGAVDDLGRLYPGFRAFGALREAMFLPGLIDGGAPPRVSRKAGALEVETLTPAGFLVTWELDGSTLGVRRARVQVSGEEITIEYSSYREVDGRFFPERFQLKDGANRVTIDGALEELDLNPALADDVFSLSLAR